MVFKLPYQDQGAQQTPHYSHGHRLLLHQHIDCGSVLRHCHNEFVEFPVDLFPLMGRIYPGFLRASDDISDCLGHVGILRRPQHLRVIGQSSIVDLY